MITLKRFRRIEAVLLEHGYLPAIEWSEGLAPPIDADAFAEQAVYVVCNSGMANFVAEPIFERCMAVLRRGQLIKRTFNHPGKRSAINRIWTYRGTLFAMYQGIDDKLWLLQRLPWIGIVTSYHLAKNLGADYAKPDVHMERLARRDRTTTHKLCDRLARQSGYRIGTIDTILWRACADGLLNSAVYEKDGWRAAFKPKAFRKAHG